MNGCAVDQSLRTEARTVICRALGKCDDRKRRLQLDVGRAGGGRRTVDGGPGKGGVRSSKGADGRDFEKRWWMAVWGGWRVRGWDGMGWDGGAGVVVVVE